MIVLHVGLDSWIIQDGNYDDFETGREYRFALEFYPHTLVVASDARVTPVLSRRSGGLHDARGKIVFCTDSAWAVDFGVPAYQNAKPPERANLGDFVRGQFYIGLDPFFYFETLRFEKGMPDLFRRWCIRRIFLETTPWRESTDRHGRKVIARDVMRESFVEVPSTDAWHHDDGRGHYVLECEMQPAAR
jgi:hypothetical protein